MSYSSETHVWFMRHANPVFDYENCTYDEFIEMLTNGFHTPLAGDHGIDFASLPHDIELICSSPVRRAKETSEKLQEHLNVGSVEKLEALREVKFDKDIIRRHEYKSIKDSIPLILQRWFKNENKTESFQKSMRRAREIEDFLQNRQEKRIILITHGLFLRVLEFYFVQGKQEEEITLSDLLNIRAIGLGEFIEAKLQVRSSQKSL